MAPATTMLQEPKARVNVQHAYPRPTLAQPKALESHSENNCAWQQLFNFEFFRLVCWYVASFFLVCLRAEAHTSLTWKGFQKHKQIVFLHSILNFHRLNLQVHVKFNLYTAFVLFFHQGSENHQDSSTFWSVTLVSHLAHFSPWCALVESVGWACSQSVGQSYDGWSFTQGFKQITLKQNDQLTICPLTTLIICVHLPRCRQVISWSPRTADMLV